MVPESTNIGLYFGSFNPLTNAHWHIALHILTITDLDEVWFVPTPLNPHKVDNKDIAPIQDRINMIQDVIDKVGVLNIHVSNIEQDMDQPNYTYKTLDRLNKSSYGEFSLIMGIDTFYSLHTWKNYEYLQSYDFYVFQRKNTINTDCGVFHTKGFNVVNDMIETNMVNCLGGFPNFNISATEVKKLLRKNDNQVKGLIPLEVKRYIKHKKLYK